MTYKASWLREVVRFKRICTPSKVRGNRVGLQQFHAFESKGIRPEVPDPFFERLLHGKKWWEWTLNEYGRLSLTDEWWGWSTVFADFADDPAGLKQVQKRIAQFRR